MSRVRTLSMAAALLCAANAARGDVTAPARATITLELTVDNQAAFPFLRFVVTNCGSGDPASIVVLEPGAPLVCHPLLGPVRMYGLRIVDVPEFFDLDKRGASRAEAAAFMAAKAKTCGQVRDEDLVFLASTGVAFVAAHYALDPGPKGGCKLRWISSTTKTAQEMPKPAAPSAAPSASAAPAPSAPVEAPAPARGCGCATRPVDASGAGAFVLACALLVARRRRATEGSG